MSKMPVSHERLLNYLSEPKASVLIVDDDPLGLELLSACLEPEGYRVTRTNSGTDALALLCEPNSHFDLLITDRCMPGLNGLELLARIKLDPRLKHIPVILQTGSASPAEVNEGIRAGVFYYLAKPYHHRQLLSLVTAAITERRNYAFLQRDLINRTKAMGMLREGLFRLKTPTECADLAMLIASIFPHPKRAVIGLSALLLNAVEHGNLEVGYAAKGELLASGKWTDELSRRQQLPQYRDRWVQARIQQIGNEISITVTDQGPGFAPGPYLALDPARATHPNGRGIAMARLISFDKVEYHGCGNEVQATSSFS